MQYLNMQLLFGHKKEWALSVVAKAFNLCEFQANQGNVVRPSPKKKKKWIGHMMINYRWTLKISKLSKSQTKKEHVSGVWFYLQKGKSVGAECMQEVPGAVGR